MYVLHVCDVMDARLGAGMAERTFQLAHGLRRAGVPCGILCCDVGLTDERRTQLAGIDLFAVPTLLRRFLVPWVSTRQIEAWVRRADVIHVMGHWSLLGALVCLVAQRLGKPYVYCPAGSLRIFGRSSGLKRLYNRWLGERVLHGAAADLVVTELEREQFDEHGIPAEKVRLLPNGVHIDSDVQPRPEVVRDRLGVGDRFLWLFLGRLSPIKGPDLLLKAFAQVAKLSPESVLLLAGPDGGLANWLREEVQRLGLSSRVYFLDFVGGQDKLDVLAAADVLVVPSRQEAMSLVALEAGMCGTPVLLTNQCGFDEVESVGGGYVVSADSDAIAQGMLRMLEHRAELRDQGRRLQALVSQRYTWDGLTQQVCDLYRTLIDAGEARRRIDG